MNKRTRDSLNAIFVHFVIVASIKSSNYVCCESHGERDPSDSTFGSPSTDQRFVSLCTFVRLISSTSQLLCFNRLNQLNWKSHEHFSRTKINLEFDQRPGTCNMHYRFLICVVPWDLQSSQWIQNDITFGPSFI